MTFNKGHQEFHTLAMDEGWQTPLGYPAGIQQKIIAGVLDEKAKRGNRTRLLRFAPGIYTTKPFVHDYWEEVFLVSGDLSSVTTSKGAAAKNSKAIPMLCARRASTTGHLSRTAVVCYWKRTSTPKTDVRCNKNWTAA